MFFGMWPFSCDYGELSLVRNVASTQRKKSWISLRKLIWLSNGGCVLTSFRGSFVFFKSKLKSLFHKIFLSKMSSLQPKNSPRFGAADCLLTLDIWDGITAILCVKGETYRRIEMGLSLVSNACMILVS